jgi:DNA-binding winged helix-turn-helix (wHTH) protein/tetratricopeptide (TPR) repeat protein
MAAGTDQSTKQLYEFGPFRVDAEKELLLRGDETIPLMPKTFQILLVLMRHKQEVVTKDELLKSVWPDTFVEEANLSRNIFLLRKALGEGPQDHQYIVTVPGRGYRFSEDVQIVPEQELSIVASHTKIQVEVKESTRWRWVATSVALIALAALGIRFFVQRKPVLSEKDTVVLADFSNSTGDPVFDGTLRQGLSVALEQSPFLSIISDQRIQQTLRLMGQPSDARLTPKIAQDLCQRTQSAAYLTGSIASLGSQYVVGLKAVSCPAGNVLAEEQETASGKENILGALDRAAGRLRKKLGESLSTVENFDTPLEQATTPSLEALQAYTLGRRTQSGKDNFALAVPFYRRAVELDPNFALAYSALGSVYWNLGETLQGAEFARRAYELHAPISGPEKFYVESTYFHYVTGDLEKARQVYELWAQTYPRDSSARIRLGQLYAMEGKHEDAVAQTREAIRLDPWKGLSFGNLVAQLANLNRFEEAAATAQQTIANRQDSPALRLVLYQLAFLENDLQAMARHAELVGGDPHYQGLLLELQAETAAYSGHLKQSRDLSRRAAESVKRDQENETATFFQALTALHEALSGEVAEARSLAASAVAMPTGRRAIYVAALSLAIAGDETRAQSLADDLAKSYPNDTLVRFNSLPAIRAEIALNGHDPLKAIELLQPTGPYDLSSVRSDFMGPVYVRGEAYLMSHRGGEAAAEFQKILDHRGLVANSALGALAHLQLGRAYVLMGNNTKAKAEFSEFLNLWKDADPDIPILQQAKAEYGKLK